MAELNSETVLQLAPSLSVELGARTVIHVGTREISASPEVLSILETFARPITYSSAVKSLSAKATGAQAWMELVSNIRALHQAGVLVDESGTVPVATGGGWSAPQVHVSMLNDRARTEAFVNAISEVVREGDVVVDVGTGTGVLAVAAAKAGARHVYAIEATEIGRAAKGVFAANGFADRITLLSGWSSHIDLPEKANVLVAEIIGNDPLEERVMETFADARRRFLTPDARIIPSRVQSYGMAVEVSDETLANSTFVPAATENWKHWYGIDFHTLLDASLNQPVVVGKRPHELRDWPQLSDPFLLADLDLGGANPPLVNQITEFTITRDGLLGGLVAYFDLEVSPRHRISTSPATAAESCSWFVKIWLTGEPRRVKKGDSFKASYRYRVDSTGTRIDIEPA